MKINNNKPHAMTKENLEKAKAALANLEAHQRLLEKIKASTAIVIGPTTTELAKSSQVIGYWSTNCTFKAGLILGLESGFFANPDLRELCLHFHQEMIRILEKELAELQAEFEKL